jgi:uncharacterized protein (DUF1697 family)
MRRHVALLRGVSPMNARMPELKRCFERAGFTNVRTLLSSGNVVFDAAAAAEATLVRRAEAAMAAELGRSFQAFVRSQAELKQLLAADPFDSFPLPPGAKRVVTFLRRPHAEALALPVQAHDALILQLRGREVLSAYVPGPRGPLFMALIEKTFGQCVTTRTWDTVRKCAAA